VSDEKPYKASGRLQDVDCLLVTDAAAQNLVVNCQNLVVLLQAAVPAQHSVNYAAGGIVSGGVCVSVCLHNVSKTTDAEADVTR